MGVGRAKYKKLRNFNLSHSFCSAIRMFRQKRTSFIVIISLCIWLSNSQSMTQLTFLARPLTKQGMVKFLKNNLFFYATLKCLISLGTALFHLPTKKLNFKDQLRQLLTKINVSSSLMVAKIWCPSK